MAAKSLLGRVLRSQPKRVVGKFSGAPLFPEFSRRKVSSNVIYGNVEDGAHSFPKVRIGVVGAPYNMGQPHQGVERAPSQIRNTGILQRLGKIGHDIKDFGDLEHKVIDEEDNSIPGLLKPSNTVNYAKQLSSQVTEVLSDNRLCLTLGGDHSVSMATVHGHLQANPEACVLWVDAHADINTPSTSDSGHMHGMPVSFQVKQMKEVMPRLDNMDWFKPLLDAKRIAYIGLRDVDPSEKVIMDRLGIAAYSMREVEELGVRECLKRSLQAINPDNSRPIHVSFDIDALDPLEAPSTGTPVRGGLSVREGMTILEDCFLTGNMTALDLVEVNTNLGNFEDGTKTLEAAKYLILSAFGYYRGGRSPLQLEEWKGKVPDSVVN